MRRSDAIEAPRFEAIRQGSQKDLYDAVVLIWRKLMERDPGLATRNTTQTLKNKTLNAPTISDFTNATHDHADAAGGGNTLTAPTIADLTNMQHDHSDAASGGAIAAGSVDHGGLAGLGDDDHTQYLNSARHDDAAHAAINHDALAGLGDDDHTQYYLVDASRQMNFLFLGELSADPSDPSEGEAVFWMSDGTGTGTDGELLVKVTAGGATNTYVLVTATP